MGNWDWLGCISPNGFSINLAMGLDSQGRPGPQGYEVAVFLGRMKRYPGIWWVFPKIMVSPNHPLVHRVFHYFHHPFWGTTIFGNTCIYHWTHQDDYTSLGGGNSNIYFMSIPTWGKMSPNLTSIWYVSKGLKVGSTTNYSSCQPGVSLLPLLTCMCCGVGDCLIFSTFGFIEYERSKSNILWVMSQIAAILVGWLIWWVPLSCYYGSKGWLNCHYGLYHG